MLAEAIAERRGMASPLEDRREAVIDVKISAFIPNEYIPQVSQKIAVYQQLAKARTQEEVEEIAAGVRDRFGAFPLPLAHLVELTKLRAIALAKHGYARGRRRARLTSASARGFQLDPAAIPKFAVADLESFPFRRGQDPGRSACAARPGADRRDLDAVAAQALGGHVNRRAGD